MSHAIPLYCGYDPREAAGYHTFTQSVIERASIPVAFHPLHAPMLKVDGQRDGTNAFVYSRFLVPYLQNFTGWALFVDACDMVCVDDIAKLWAHREANQFDKALCVVHHDYLSRHKRKYIGTPMEADNFNYPRKNQSSVILWNCAHFANRLLTPEFIAQSPGSFLHRLSWVKESQIGRLDPTWNALAEEHDISLASLIHFTLGVPGFEHYRACAGAEHWHRARRAAMHLAGEPHCGL